jgi:hypothetical protein
MYYRLTQCCTRLCWTEDDGIHSRGHEHESVPDAMKCLVPDGRSFLRACESGAYRSLNETEFGYFLAALIEMPWKTPSPSSAGSTAKERAGKERAGKG